MKTRLAMAALWLLCATAAARDPFAPPLATRCAHQPPELSQWRLQGIIGRSGDYRGWLLSPQGQRVRATAGSDLPLSPWRVSEVDAFALQVQAGQGCGQQPFSWRLKGRLYDKDYHAAAVVTEPAGAQQ